MKQAVLVFFVAITCIGCSSSKGFNRFALNNQIGVKTHQITDADIEKTLSLKPNLPKPFRLGVYFRQPQQQRYGWTEWRWDEKDKEYILEIKKRFEDTGMVSEVFQISHTTVNSDSIKDIRMGAARHNADAVLLISGAGDIDNYTNNLAATYFLLLPAFFVPASEKDALFMANATLWDVRNEYLYLTAEAEHLEQETYPAAFGPTNKEVLTRAKKSALKKLSGEVLNMVKGIKDSKPEEATIRIDLRESQRNKRQNISTRIVLPANKRVRLAGGETRRKESKTVILDKSFFSVESEHFPDAVRFKFFKNEEPIGTIQMLKRSGEFAQLQVDEREIRIRIEAVN